METIANYHYYYFFITSMIQNDEIIHNINCFMRYLLSVSNIVYEAVYHAGVLSTLE